MATFNDTSDATLPVNYTPTKRGEKGDVGRHYKNLTNIVLSTVKNQVLLKYECFNANRGVIHL